MHNRAYSFHHETRTTLQATVPAAFEHLDDFRNLSAHMEQPSAMMLGSRMRLFTDDGDGRTIGSHVRMSGRVLGIPLSLEEVVTERQPPTRKAWETVDARLLVIGQYRLGFELEPLAGACALRVFIDYDWPSGAFARRAAALLARSYARWCTERIAGDAVKRFAAAEPADRGT